MCVSRVRATVALRSLALLALAATLASCATTAAPVKKKGPDPVHVAMYGPRPDERFPMPAIDISGVNPKYFRQQVAYQTMEPAGTIVIDTQNRFLYLVQGEGMAMRYGIGVGKSGFAWQGEAYIAWKQEWPTWHPPKEMAERKPDVARYVKDGMGPGLKNPLGARAMYLFNDKGQDTLFRLHGTPEWASIGTAASSGCIRLMNQDIIDLYKRVRPGTSARVVVQQ